MFLSCAWFAHGPFENFNERNSAHWSADASQRGMSLCLGVFVPLRLRLHLHTGVDVIHIVHVCTVASAQTNTSGDSLLGIPYWGAHSPQWGFPSAERTPPHGDPPLGSEHSRVGSPHGAVYTPQWELPHAWFAPGLRMVCEWFLLNMCSIFRRWGQLGACCACDM